MYPVIAVLLQYTCNVHSTRKADSE